MIKQLVTTARNGSIALGVALSTSSMAFAEGGASPIDVTGAVSVVTNQGGAAIAAVGQALIGLAATVLVFKWVKATFF